jgi:glyoxylase-like metal-dependent hydrolase (beta-lactamase superfamily II)
MTKFIASSLALLSLSSVFGQSQDQGFTCSRTLGASTVETAIELEWCLDSDPLPDAIFTPSPENIFLQSFEGLAVVPLGGGHYVIGDGVYMSALYIFEGEFKGPKGKARALKGEEMRKMKSSKKDGNKMVKSSKKDGKKMESSSKKDGNKMESSKKGTEMMDESGGTLGAILVDAPPNYGPNFGTFLKDLLDSMGAELKVVILTHEHSDHIGGINAVLKANPTYETIITSAASAETLRSFAMPNYSNARLQEIFSANPNFPDVDIDMELEEGREDLVIGNQTLDIRIGKGHTPGHMIIYHEASKSITSVDSAVFPKWSPFFKIAISHDIPALIAQFDLLREYDYDFFIGGHFTHIGTPADVAVSEAYIVDIVDAAFRALQTVDITSIINGVGVSEGQNAGNIMLLFGAYLNEVGVTCANTILDSSLTYSGTDWVTTLGGVRTTLFSHCKSVVDVLRVEAPAI